MLAASRTTAPEQFEHTYRLSFKYLSAVILPAAMLLTVLRHEFVTIAFGPQYGGSAAPLAILAWSMFFAYAGAVYLNLIIVEHRQRLLLLVSAVAVAVNIGVNLWLIPIYGATGAAWATLISNAVGFVCWTVHPYTARLIAACISEALRPLAAVAAAFIVLAVLPVAGISAGLVALAVYAAVMVMCGGISRSDIDLVRRLFAERAAEPIGDR